MDKLKWVVAAALGVVLLVVGGTWVYINVIRDDPPERLTFDAADQEHGSDAGDTDATDTTDGTEPATDDGTPVELEGRWEVSPGSVVGYRVGEILFGQTTEGVGRTEDVEGHLVIEGTTVTDATFVADMTTVESDDSRRDRQFQGRIMDTDSHPTATLELAEPIELDSIPEVGDILETTASVTLTLRGTTRTVPVDLRARRGTAAIEIDGSLEVVFEEWGIPNPSTTGITTEDTGELEFLLVLARA